MILLKKIMNFIAVFFNKLNSVIILGLKGSLIKLDLKINAFYNNIINIKYFNVYTIASVPSLQYTIDPLKIYRIQENLIFYQNKLLRLEYINTLFDIWLLPEFFLSLIILYYIFIYIYLIFKQKYLKSLDFYFITSLLLKFCCYLLIVLFNILYILLKFNLCIFYLNFFMINIFSIIIKIIITLIFLYILYIVRFWYFQYQKYIIEIYFLLLSSLFFSYILLSSINLMLAYIAIEGLSLQVYALAILNFTTISIEIILKYFLLGSLASAILLYGISLLYGLYGSLNFFILKNSFFKIYLLDFFFNSNLCKISIFLIFFGLLFKLGLYPLHFWVPSVYSNSPNIVIFFLNTIIKLVLFIFTFNLFIVIFFYFLYSLKLYFIISCIGSMLIGAVGACKELKIKNFISYTSINQIGFLMIGLICYSELSIYYCLYYLFIYLILTIGFLNIIFNIQQAFTHQPVIYFNDLKFFYKKNIIFSFIFSTYILSFAGLPPFCGFFGKLNIYFSIMNSKMFLLLFIIMFLNLISLYYYIKILKIIWFENLINFDNKYLPYRIKKSKLINFTIFLTSIFNIFFLLIIDIYDSFILKLFFSMMLTS